MTIFSLHAACSEMLQPDMVGCKLVLDAAALSPWDGMAGSMSTGACHRHFAFVPMAICFVHWLAGGPRATCLAEEPAITQRRFTPKKKRDD